MTIAAKTGHLYQHLKSGGIYRVVTLGIIEATLEAAVVYQAQDGHGAVWIRPTKEFCDGRFVEVAGGGIAPHDYVPDAMAMGDCRICGHIAESPVHAVRAGA